MAALRDGKHFDTIFVTKKGERIPVAVAGSIIRDGAAAELGSIGFAKDLREIRRHDQLATLGEVAIGLAHEINNPLEVIVNNLNLLEAHVAKVSSDEDFVVEGARLDSIRGQAHPAHRHAADRDGAGLGYATRSTSGTQMTDFPDAGGCADGGRPAALEPHDRRSRHPHLVIGDDLGVTTRCAICSPGGLRVLVATGGRGRSRGSKRRS
jgi:hypothetical protein